MWVHAQPNPRLRSGRGTEVDDRTDIPGLCRLFFGKNRDNFKLFMGFDLTNAVKLERALLLHDIAEQTESEVVKFVLKTFLELTER